MERGEGQKKFRKVTPEMERKEIKGMIMENRKN